MVQISAKDALRQAGRWRGLFSAPHGNIELAIDGVAEPKAVMLILHPHPLYGGTMDNKVVVTLARACRQMQVTAVRFNFRGVGASDGAHDGGVAECDDTVTLVAWLEQALPDIPVILGGFSFGAAIAAQVASRLPVKGLLLVAPPVPCYGLAALQKFAMPLLVILGSADEVLDCIVVRAWFSQLDAPSRQWRERHGASHFFHGELPWLREQAEQFLSTLLA